MGLICGQCLCLDNVCIFFFFCLSVGCLDMTMQYVQLLLIALDQLLAPSHSGWTTCSAQELRLPWTSAVFRGGGCTIAIMAQMMPELYVLTVSKLATYFGQGSYQLLV